MFRCRSFIRTLIILHHFIGWFTFHVFLHNTDDFRRTQVRSSNNKCLEWSNDLEVPIDKRNGILVLSSTISIDCEFQVCEWPNHEYSCTIVWLRAFKAISEANAKKNKITLKKCSNQFSSRFSNNSPKWIYLNRWRIIQMCIAFIE